jgi:iron(II)-dependent oxidoreductase
MPSSLQPEALAERARAGGPADLAEALQASRQDTLRTFAAWEAGLPRLHVPCDEGLNPPLWELGHIGWFQSWWLTRNPAWRQGLRVDPRVRRAPPARPEADGWYDSSRVPHRQRWGLPLPDARATREDLARGLDAALSLLAGTDETALGSDDALYFFRLALFHEDMHHEASLYMAHRLGVPIGDARWRPRPLPAPPPALAFEAGPWSLGSPAGHAFAFDNELDAHPVTLAATEIDAQAVRWAEFLPFVEDGGYLQTRWWTREGRDWLARSARRAPAALRRDGQGWLRVFEGRWQPLDPREAACHLTAHEALAWCRWAGRRLPTEAEWERAACTSPPGRFRWGDVWEWTASAFSPYPGFVAHPYRDYSAPWFDGRPVLRGASFMTQPRIRHPRYRNYFQAHRDDVPAGLRSCAL